MKFSEVKGDLFSCDAACSLAHCISEDCRMGKGIAVAFRDKFGSVDELKRQVSGGAKTGHVAILKKGSRFIYYLITKAKYFQKPTYDGLRSSLEAVKRHCSANGVSQLAMPRIGCGLDGLDWKTVEPTIKDVFADTDIDITIYYR